MKPSPDQKDLVQHMMRGILKDIERITRLLDPEDAIVIQRLRMATHEIKVARSQLK